MIAKDMAVLKVLAQRIRGVFHVMRHINPRSTLHYVNVSSRLCLLPEKTRQRTFRRESGIRRRKKE